MYNVFIYRNNKQICIPAESYDKATACAKQFWNLDPLIYDCNKKQIVPSTGDVLESEL